MASPQLQALVGALKSGPPIDWSPSGREPFAQAVGRFPVPEGTGSEAVVAGGVPGEWIGVTAPASGRTLLYFHGGGYTIGSVAAYRPLIARLCAAMDARGLAIDYRLAPSILFRPRLTMRQRHIAGCSKAASNRLTSPSGAIPRAAG